MICSGFVVYWYCHVIPAVLGFFPLAPRLVSGFVLCVWLFFCSNAIIALARSLCKCLLAVLVTASEAKAVIASTRGVESYDVIPHGEKPTTDTGKQEKQQQTKTAKPKNQTKSTTHHGRGMKYPKATHET